MCRLPMIVGASRPVGHYQGDQEGWKRRTPIRTKDSAGAATYPYALVGTDMRSEFHETIFDGKASDQLFGLVCRDKLEYMFRTREIYELWNSWILWRVYAIAVLLSNDWFAIAPDRKGLVLRIRHRVSWDRVTLDWLNGLKELEVEFTRSEIHIKRSSLRQPRQLLRMLYSRFIKRLKRRLQQLATRRKLLYDFLRACEKQLSGVQAKHQVPLEQWNAFLKNTPINPPVRFGDMSICNFLGFQSILQDHGDQWCRSCLNASHAVTPSTTIDNWIDEIRIAVSVHEGE